MSSTKNFQSGVDYINSMTREEFHKKVVRGIAQNSDFSFVATFLSADSPENIKTNVKNMLIEIGLPAESIQTDYDLDMVVGAIAGRSVELR